MICVDPEFSCLTNPRWRWPVVTHLFSDDGNLEELHAFAQALGLKRCWFQKHANTPHYDLSPNLRAAALRCGAKPLSRAEAGAIFRRNRLARRGGLHPPRDG